MLTWTKLVAYLVELNKRVFVTKSSDGLPPLVVPISITNKLRWQLTKMEATTIGTFIPTAASKADPTNSHDCGFIDMTADCRQYARFEYSMYCPTHNYSNERTTDRPTVCLAVASNCLLIHLFIPPAIQSCHHTG